MELKILSSKGEEGKIKIPSQFNEFIRTDLIKRAVIAVQANKRQPYGADPRAGKRYSAKLSRRRREYKGSYGKGISRVPRKTMWRRGTQMQWVGAYAPGTVGGRRAHPPKAEKSFKQKINDKERKKAIRSALTATLSKELTKKRGHLTPETYPFILSNEAEKISKTRDVIKLLQNMGLEKELERVSVKKIRAGMGKNRGRPYNKKKGPLIIVGDTCQLSKSAKNIPGINVSNVKNINAELLAPGTIPGRLTLYTKNAIEIMQKDNLFN